MNTPVVRFPDAAARFPQLPEFLKRMIGYEAVRLHDDFVILDNDRYFLQKRRAASVESTIDLVAGNRQKISGLLIRALPKTMQPFYSGKDLTVRMEFAEFSELPRFYKMAVDLVTAPPNELRRVLRDEVLPRMIDEVGAQWACPVVVQSTPQQAHFAAAKMLLLLNDNDLTNAERLAVDRKVYAAIVPSSLDLSSYVITLTRFLPFMFTVPAQRQDCVWHFVAKGTLHFEHVRCVSLFETLCEKPAPLGSPLGLRGIRQLATMDANAILAYLGIAVDSVSNLMSFLNDWRNFRKDDLSVDFGSQLQAYASFNLLFADIASMASRPFGYDRVTRAMAAIDKISNLVKNFSRTSSSEAEIFKSVFGNAHRRTLDYIIESSVEDPALSATLRASVQEAYDGLVCFYKRDLGIEGQELIEKIQEHIRTQRNLHHGAFLRGNDFHAAFGTSSGRVADEIVFIAFVTTLCVGLAPKLYLTGSSDAE